VIVRALAVLATALSGTTASLHVTLSPNRAGARTLMRFGFHIDSPEGLPPALTHLTVGLPKGLGIDMAGVGTCQAARLEAGGSCSTNAQVGQGSVTVAVPLGEQVRTERAKLTVYKGPTHPSTSPPTSFSTRLLTRSPARPVVRGDQTLLFDAVGRVPIATRIVFKAIVAPGAQGASIQATIPLEATLPNSPDAAITSLAATLGTLGRIYHQTTKNKNLSFTPKGITLPRGCPTAGLPFKAVFAFDDGGQISASTSIACRS
jgi:hypothetical protein